MKEYNILEKKFIENIESLSIFFTTKDFVITGATGVLGVALIRLLSEIKNRNDFEYKIHGFCRNEEKLKKNVDGDVHFYKYSMESEINVNIEKPVIIHLASPTSTEIFLNQPSSVHEQISFSTKYISEFAIKSNATKLIVLSTMEVYGEQPDNILIDETMNFGIDPLNTRNSYPLAKISMENYLLGKFKEIDLPVSILRLTQTIALPVDDSDNRVIFSFARSVAKEEDIEMKTSGLTYRSYIYILDALSAILVIAHQGINGQIYNVAAPDTCISIVELATKFIQISNSKSKIRFTKTDISNTGYRDSLGLCIDSSKLLGIGWKPIFDLDISLQMLVDYYRNH